MPRCDRRRPHKRCSRRSMSLIVCRRRLRTILSSAVECYIRGAMPPFYVVVCLGPLPRRRCASENASLSPKLVDTSPRFFWHCWSRSSLIAPSETSHLALFDRHAVCRQCVLVSHPHRMRHRSNRPVRLVDRCVAAFVVSEARLPICRCPFSFNMFIFPRSTS